MAAGDLINSTVTKKYRDKTHIRAIIEDKDSWWHVHRNEELPVDYPVIVYIRV